MHKLRLVWLHNRIAEARQESIKSFFRCGNGGTMEVQNNVDSELYMIE